MSDTGEEAGYYNSSLIHELFVNDVSETNMAGEKTKRNAITTGRAMSLRTHIFFRRRTRNNIHLLQKIKLERKP